MESKIRALQPWDFGRKDACFLFVPFPSTFILYYQMDTLEKTTLRLKEDLRRGLIILLFTK